ncbi:efflux RND transporter periplasmic adaptor subunit [bacterium]|nr:efflux RND transporter periplasmic adaptor subunit [bacterium]
MSKSQSLSDREKGAFWGRNRRQMMMVLVPVVVGVLFLGGDLIMTKNVDLSIPSVVVKRGPVAIKITEIGELRAQKQVTISAINDKQIVWMIPEGLWVEPGDTLIRMESEKYILSTGEAESNLLVAKADLAKARSDLEAQRIKEEAARKNYESLPELAKKGFVMESEVEQARLTYIELKSRTNSFLAGVNAARANVQRADRMLKQQERKLREGVMLAPRAGLVVYAMVGNQQDLRRVEVGMIPFEGMDLMYLPDVSSMLVDTEISEVDLSRVTPSLPAEIRLDAYPDDVFNGEVMKVADLAKRKISRITGQLTGAKVFDVTVKVLAEDLRLKPGLSATVDLIVNEHEDVLYVPLEAIFYDEQDQNIVYLKNGDSYEARRVSIGESNDRVVIVLGGLQEGDKVLLSRPAAT